MNASGLDEQVTAGLRVGLLLDIVLTLPGAADAKTRRVKLRSFRGQSGFARERLSCRSGCRRDAAAQVAASDSVCKACREEFIALSELLALEWELTAPGQNRPPSYA